MGRRSSHSILLLLSHNMILLLALLIQYQVAPSDAAEPYFNYCENGELKNVSFRTCQNGINFGTGQTRPNCVCIYGIYRMYTDGCEVADGFASDNYGVCTKLDDNSQLVASMKIASMPEKYEFDSPAFVLEQNQKFTLRTGSSPVLTSEKEFYSVKAKPYIMQDGDGSGVICLKNESQAKKICHYLQKDNKDIWTSTKVSISITESCANAKPLISNNCFDPLTNAESECSLACGSSSSSSSMNKAPSAEEFQVSSARGVRRKMVNLTRADFDKNCTNPDDYRNHDNRFLNRKMLLYNVVNQLDMRNDSNTSILETMEPNNTLSLFNSMKNITQLICPTEYVSSEWIDQVVDLFYILHKGDVFRYEEQLSPEQHTWISQILNDCQLNITGKTSNVVLSSMNAGGSNTSDECVGSGLATGYCRQPLNETSQHSPGCNFVPVTVDTTSEHSHRNKHYVPEVAWNIVDLIHVVCFPQFNESYRMFHVLEQAVEKLFTLQIKNLWHHPGWLEKTKTKLLGYGADNNMYNFDACIQGAYGHRFGELPRLVRPFAPMYLRRRRSVTQNVSKVKPPSGRRAAKGRASGSARAAKGRASGMEAGTTYCVKSPSDLIIPSNCKNNPSP